MKTAWIALAMIVACGALADSQPPTPGAADAVTKPQSATSQYQKHTENAKAATQGAPTIIETAQTTVVYDPPSDKSEKRRDHSSPEWWIVYITGALAVITLALALYTAKLWRSTGKLVRGSEDTARRQLRAYVSINPKSMGFSLVKPLSLSEQPVLMRCLIKNHGQTPANKINHRFDIAVFPEPLPNEFKFPEASRIHGGVNIGLAPSIEMSSNFERPEPLTAEEIAKIETGSYRLYLWGITKYRDAFDRDWQTKFCASVGGKLLIDILRRYLIAAESGKPVQLPHGLAAPFDWSYGPEHGEAD
jgi:hypothetical protein